MWHGADLLILSSALDEKQKTQTSIVIGI
jgi:hypothetical protein